MKNDALVGFKNVRFCYGEVCAIESVNFSLDKNEITVLVGPNGGGKSTLLKLLTGLLKPEEGSISFYNGTEIGYVSQNPSFDMSFPLTVEELVLQGTLPKAVKPFAKYSQEQKQKAAEAVMRAGMKGFENRSIGQLSAGQLKRTVIARAIASDASLIALDEPDASLDIDAAKELYAILNTLKKDKTVVIASHNIEAITAIADKAVYVNKTAREFAEPGKLKELLKGGILL